MTKDELRTTLATLIKTLPKVQRLCEWAQNQDLILELLALILSRSEADRPMPSQFELLALFVMRMPAEHRGELMERLESGRIVNFSYELKRKGKVKHAKTKRR